MDFAHTNRKWDCGTVLEQMSRTLPEMGVRLAEASAAQGLGRAGQPVAAGPNGYRWRSCAQCRPPDPTYDSYVRNASLAMSSAVGTADLSPTAPAAMLSVQNLAGARQASAGA